MVEKSVEVKVEEKEEEILDGWIRLTLYYPDNSTNWEWRIGKEGELNAAACFLGSKEASYVTGVILPVDGGYTCV